MPDKLYYSVEMAMCGVAVINFAANLDARQWWIQMRHVQLHLEGAGRSPARLLYQSQRQQRGLLTVIFPAAAEAAGINVVFSGHDHSRAPHHGVEGMASL